MTEIWKDIPGYEGLYQVSNLGNVKSFRGSAKFGKPKEMLLKPSPINTGYLVVTLYGEGKTKRKFQVHRLVAETFIPNPNKLPCVNHRDENKTNNAVENLEWCSYQYNNNYGTAKIRRADTIARTIKQYSLDGRLIALYKSTGIAAEILKEEKHTISRWCREGFGGGYMWELSDESLQVFQPKSQ